MRPENSENCDIKYIVNVVVGNVTVLTKETAETELSVDVDIKPCQEFEVILTPVSPAGAKGPRANREDIARLFSNYYIKLLVLKSVHIFIRLQVSILLSIWANVMEGYHGINPKISAYAKFISTCL